MTADRHTIGYAGLSKRPAEADKNDTSNWTYSIFKEYQSHYVP